MRNIYILIIICILGFSCQKQNFHDTGLAKGIHETSILEYMRGDSYNWDTTVLVIERAGLEDLFEGKDPEYPEITFLGCTNLSIMRYMFPRDYLKVEDIPVEECKKLLLRHVIKGKLMKADIPKGIAYPKQGGQDFETLGDNKLWLYTFTNPFRGVPNAGSTHIYLQSYTAYSRHDIASADLVCDNGVVHSLHYNYVFGEI